MHKESGLVFMRSCDRQKKLYVRFRGTIGDTVHYLVRMRDVRRKHPQHWIKCAIASPIAYQLRELIELDPYIDEIEVLPPHDPGFVVSPCFRRKTQTEIGRSGKFLDFVLPDYGDLLQFEIDKAWRPALCASDVAFADSFFDTYIRDAGLIVLHMVSGRGKGKEWQWGTNKYQQLAALIHRDYPHRILAVGNVAASFCQDGSMLDLSSNVELGVSLRQVIALIARADLVIGGDSGFQVLPWLCGISVISLVPQYHIAGHALPDNGRWLGKVIDVSMFLPEAYADKSGSVILPVESTSVDEVWAHVSRLLGEPKPAVPMKEHPLPPYVRRRHKPWVWIWYRTALLKWLRKLAGFAFAPWYPKSRISVVRRQLLRVVHKIRRLACGLG